MRSLSLSLSQDDLGYDSADASLRRVGFTTGLRRPVDIQQSYRLYNRSVNVGLTCLTWTLKLVLSLALAGI